MMTEIKQGDVYALNIIFSLYIYAYHSQDL